MALRLMVVMDIDHFVTSPRCMSHSGKVGMRWELPVACDWLTLSLRLQKYLRLRASFPPTASAPFLPSPTTPYSPSDAELGNKGEKCRSNNNLLPHTERPVTRTEPAATKQIVQEFGPERSVQDGESLPGCGLLEAFMDASNLGWLARLAAAWNMSRCASGGVCVDSVAADKRPRNIAWQHVILQNERKQTEAPPRHSLA
ncbi:hypothetical protein GE09DRAFT_233735 [Coniochaeta sp. 2T2.1]|nr:hypothetical protein GE09DRAFT_233735 [Coniochaeta sp. 2T2.1]